MGRRKKTISKRGHQIIRDLAQRGVNETDIAKALGLGYDTWVRIKREDETTREVLEQARMIEHDKLFGVLYEKAMKGDSTASMFLLKTRHGYKEGAEVQNTNAIAVQITLPGSMKPEEYIKTMQINQQEDETK
ncbi:MAG: hypothetical protein JJU41_13660 [Bacteroidetes bacterium]|nr:hypothetical protein [Bacteroidota bacterium]